MTTREDFRALCTHCEGGVEVRNGNVVIPVQPTQHRVCREVRIVRSILEVEADVIIVGQLTDLE